MLKIEDAVRVISRNGKKYYHSCRSCSKEIGPNTAAALKTRSGYCNSCFKVRQHHPGKSLLRRIKESARGRTTVTLTEDQAAFLKQICMCHYCGGKVSWSGAATNIDRKDPNRGYDWDNIAIACFNCNRMKSNVLSYDEMRIAIQAVRLYRSLNDDLKKELELSLMDWPADSS